MYFPLKVYFSMICMHFQCAKNCSCVFLCHSSWWFIPSFFRRDYFSLIPKRVPAKTTSKVFTCNIISYSVRFYSHIPSIFWLAGKFINLGFMHYLCNELPKSGKLLKINIYWKPIYWIVFTVSVLIGFKIFIRLYDAESI